LASRKGKPGIEKEYQWERRGCATEKSSIVCLNDKIVGWIIDSGASSHICNNEQLFTKMETLKKPLEIVWGEWWNISVCSGITVLVQGPPL